MTEYWTEMPMRGTANPHEPRIRSFKKNNIWVYIRTMQPNNTNYPIQVWKENKKSKKIYPIIEFENNFEGNKKAYLYARKLMKNEEIQEHKWLNG